MKRKAISFATITLHVKQYNDDQSVTHIDIEQTASGGIKGTTELRYLNWEQGEHEDDVFGAVRGRTRWVQDLAAGESGAGGKLDPYLLEGWEASEVGYVQSWVESVKNGWTAEQIWGFATVDGVRYYTRRVVVKKGDKVIRARLIYTYAGAYTPS